MKQSKTKLSLVIASLFIGGSTLTAQNIGTNATGGAPDPSAMLDVNSNDQGMLVPRIALTGTNDITTIASPAVSLLIYNTATISDVTPGFYYFDGTNWIRIVTGVADTDDQNISGSGLTGTTLTIGIENGTNETVDLSSLQDGTGTDSQTLTLTGNSLAISGGNTVTLPADSDSQDLNLSGNTLSLTNDNTNVDLSGYLDNTDSQNLNSSVSNGSATVNISGGTGTTFSVDDADADSTNEYNTSISLTGTTLNVIDGGGTKSVNLSGLQDGTGTDSQSLTLTGNSLAISGGNTVTLPAGSDSQDLSLSGNTLSLTNDNTNVDLSGYLDNTDSQNLSSSVSNGSATINISGGTSTTFSVNDADADSTNENNISVSLTGTTLNIIDGGGTKSVNLSSLQDGTGTDNQDLSLSGNTLSLTNDNTNVDLSGYLDNSDSQNLSSSVSNGSATVNISGGTSTTFSVNDADADSTNEYNISASLTGTTLNIIDGGGTKTVSLGGLKAHDWYEVGGTIQPDNINDNIYTQGNVGIGVTNPVMSLAIKKTGGATQVLLDSDNGQHSYLTFRPASGTTNEFNVGYDNTNDILSIASSTFPTNSGEGIHYRRNGDVGINTTTPTAKLDVNGTTRLRNLPVYSSQSDTLCLVADGTGDLHEVSFMTLAERMRLFLAYSSGTVFCTGTPTAIVDVLNPITGDIWMDRNLGASQAATSSTDVQAYGDLYQWGRAADGHQCRNSGTTSTNSSNDMPGHSDFILEPNTPYDWRASQNDNLWQGVDGINNPCPSGYRIPTEAELETERLSWTGGNNNSGAYSSPLKLPAAGSRDFTNGSIYNVGANGRYWSSTVSSGRIRYLVFYSGGAGMLSNDRANGFLIRCIKENVSTPSIAAVYCNGSPTTVVDVVNPTTGETWMDRNLGASQVATSSTDVQAYGDLYQWGRAADGHQCRNSGTSSTNATNDIPGHNGFILEASSPYDWRVPRNDNLWQGVNGINNPCPSGYRIPTEAELNAERLSWSSNNRSGAYGSPLKFPVSGYRRHSNGTFSNVGVSGVYWSSTVSGVSSVSLNFNSSNSYTYNDRRAYGYSVRCIRN